MVLVSPLASRRTNPIDRIAPTSRSKLLANPRSNPSFRRAVQLAANIAICDLPLIFPPELTADAQSLLADVHEVEAARCLETKGDSLQDFIVAELVAETYPDASDYEIQYIAQVLGSNQTLNHFAWRFMDGDPTMLRGKEGADILEMLIGALVYDDSDQGFSYARRWYTLYFPPVMKRAFKMYKRCSCLHPDDVPRLMHASAKTLADRVSTLSSTSA